MWLWRRGKDEDRLGLKVDLIRQQLDEMLHIFAEVGVQVTSAAADAVEGVPPSLIASSRIRSSSPEPVMLTGTDGRQAIAVVGGHGDPAQWWDSVRRAVPPARDHATGLRHAWLADGLYAVAVPGAAAATITVSSALDGPDRRAAVRTAVRAARRAGWLPSRVPVFLLPLLAGRHAAAKLLAAKAPATATALVAGGAVTVALLAVHPVHRPPVAFQHGRAPVVTAPHRVGHRGRKHRRGHSGSRPVLIAAGHLPQPQSSGSPQPVPTSTTTTPPSRSPSPGPSPTTPSPTPSPSPSPSPTGGGCIEVLGVMVCLGAGL